MLTPSEDFLISGEKQPASSAMPAVSCPYTFVCEDTHQQVEPSKTPTNGGKPWNKAKATIFSPAMRRKIASDSGSSSVYFHALPYTKRIKLLKVTKGLTDISVELADSLADSMKLPSAKLRNWLWLRQQKNRKIALNQGLSAEVIPLLNEEFELSSCLIEERLLLLSYELDLSPDVIRLWFRRQKILKKVGLPSRGGSTEAENSLFQSIGGSSNATGENCALSTPADEKLIYSSSLSARVESLKQTCFFYSLSPADQLLLLKRFHELPLRGPIPIMDIAAELVAALTPPSERSTQAPDIADLVIWLQETRKLYVGLAKTEYPTTVREEVAAFLEDEFITSNAATDGRVLMLSYVLALTLEQVREWFCQRNAVFQEQSVVSVSPATLSSTRVATSCTEAQYAQLMKTFKAAASSTNIEEVADQTQLPPSQVQYWFSATQQSLRSFTKNQMLHNLAAGLSEYVIMELEERYCCSRRISFQQAAASASILGMENAKCVLSWFEWRRTYELLEAYNSGENIEISHERIANILEGRFPKPPGILIDSSKYGICYDDSNYPTFPQWNDAAENPNYSAASPKETSNQRFQVAFAAESKQD